jgi:hypothetical protein
MVIIVICHIYQFDVSVSSHHLFFASESTASTALAFYSKFYSFLDAGLFLM